MPKFGLIGYPAAGSKSPALFKAAYSGRYPYEIIEEEDFDKAFARFIREDFQAINITAPHKRRAADTADWRSPDVERIGAANILIKTPSGSVEAFNSDVLAVRKLIDGLDACLTSGLKTSALRHDQVGDDRIEADLVIYTLPIAVPGIENIKCRYLLEANYLTPACSDLPGVDHYISGKQWLKAQAILGYGLMTGEEPDAEAIASSI